MIEIFYFILWTLLIYWCHRAMHVVPLLKEFHLDHHRVVDKGEIRGFHWTNVLLYFDNFESTVDQWLTEVVPTIIFCLITGSWWIAIFYYVWAAFIQEQVEHEYDFNLMPFITSGRWHLLHHDDKDKNFGFLTFIWDRLFETEKKLDDNSRKLV